MQKHLQIHGSVQGVFFRDSAKKEAKRLGINGWIRNNPDGTVELVVQGSKKSLESFRAWCASGPAHASVDKVEELSLPEEVDFQDFEIRF